MRDCKATILNNRDQRGVALIMALMLLLLLTALAAALVFVANLETSVNANYRREQVLYFAGKAGIEEARDRLMATNPNTLIVTGTVPTCTPAANHDCLPATPVVPSTANGGVFYIRGGATPTAVTPWTSGTAYTDDELCHDKYALPGQTAEPADVRCIDEPTGTTWYKSTTSAIPWSPAVGATNAAALPYQWVRISLKLNGSVDNNLSTRRVSSTDLTGTIPVCWDGSREILKNPAAADCTKMVTLAVPGPAASPVYLVTSLAVDPTSNARRMMQAELALSPSTPFPSGMFATSSACNALSLQGNVSTNSFDSSVSPPVYATTGGTIGSNGGVSITGGAVSVGGSIETSAVTASGTPNSCPPAPASSLSAPKPPNAISTFPTPYTEVPPPIPVGPTNTLYTPPKPAGCATAGCMVPGTYGNISLSGASGTLTLSPGVYNINSLSAGGLAGITVNPPGVVVINVAGNGLAAATPVVDIGSNSVVNTPVPPATTSNPNNFQINYGGTGSINISAGSKTYAVVNAPAANIVMNGGGGASDGFWGAVIGGTITATGTINFYYDRNLTGFPSLGSYQEISFRDVMY